MKNSTTLKLISADREGLPGNGTGVSSSRPSVPGDSRKHTTDQIGKWGEPSDRVGGPNSGLRAIPPGGRDELWTAKRLAKELGIPVKSVYCLGIPCVKLSPRRYRWWLSEILTYFEERGSET